jgi:hypothetical protein
MQNIRARILHHGLRITAELEYRTLNANYWKDIIAIVIIT